MAGINWGNLVKQYLNPNADYDVIDGVSVAGGDRSPAQGQWIGPTASNSSSAPKSQPSNGGANDTNTAATPTYDAGAASDAAGRASTVGMLDSELEAIAKSLGNLDSTWAAGKNQIEDAKNKSLSRANQQQSSALSKYATQRADTKQAFNRSVEDVDNQAYDNYSALKSMLGRSGAGSSSAAENVVPYAVSNTASKARGNIADTYGKNNRDLTDAEDDTKTSYNNIVQDISDQERKSLGDLESDIQGKRSAYENNRASILGQKAQAQGGGWQTVKDAMQPAVNNRDSIDQALSTLLDRYRSPYTVQDVSVKDPTLGTYSVDANGVKNDSADAGGANADTSADYLAQLKEEDKRKKEQQGLTA